MKDQTELIQELFARIDRLEKENALLKEQNVYLMKKLYGRKSETSVSIGLSMDERSFSLEENEIPPSTLISNERATKTP